MDKKGSHGNLHKDFRELLKPGDTWQGQCLCKEGPTGRCVNLRSWKPKLQSRPQNVGHAKTMGHNTGDSCRHEMEPDQEKS